MRKDSGAAKMGGPQDDADFVGYARAAEFRRRTYSSRTGSTIFDTVSLPSSAWSPLFSAISLEPSEATPKSCGIRKHYQRERDTEQNILLVRCARPPKPAGGVSFFFPFFRSFPACAWPRRLHCTAG